MSPGFETELNRHMPVGSKRCQSALALLVLTRHCLRQIEVNQICVRGLLLRALSLYSWQQWAHWWIIGLYANQSVYVFKAVCVCQRGGGMGGEWEPSLHINVKDGLHIWELHKSQIKLPELQLWLNLHNLSIFLIILYFWKIFFCLQSTFEMYKLIKILQLMLKRP